LTGISCPSGPRILLSREGGFSKHDGKVRGVDGFIPSLNTQSRIASPSKELGAHSSSGLEVLRI